MAFVLCGPWLAAVDVERITSFAKESIEVDLERVSKEPAQCQVRFVNRNTYSVKVIYRVKPSRGDELRREAILPANIIKNASEHRDPVIVQLPSGNYDSIEFISIIRGYTRERTGTRVSSDGTSETYHEIEFTSREDVELAQRELTLAREREERRYREQHPTHPQDPVVPKPQTWEERRHREQPPTRPQVPVVQKPQTWEEKRDEQLRNERKAWPNP